MGAIGGFSAGRGDAGGLVGGTVAFDVSDRITAEARGIYGDRGAGKDAVEVTGTMLVTLARSKRTSAYAGVGGGLYRTSFDLGDVYMDVDGDRDFGSPFFGHRMPRFYADRLRTDPTGRDGTQTFTDPALTFGGGLKVDLTDRFFVAPDVRGLIVLSRGDQMTLMTMSVRVGVRF